MSNPTELLNCPFCGETPSLLLDEDNCRYVSCEPCSVAMPAYRPGFEQNAIQAWNRRAQPEGEAPQADEVAAFNAWAVDNGSKTTAEFELGGDGQGYLNAFRAGAKFAATLSPLCGAQHAESGKEAYQVFSHDSGEWYGVDKAQYDRAHDSCRRVLAVQQAAAPGAHQVTAIEALGRNDAAVHAYLCLMRKSGLEWGYVLAEMVLHLANEKEWLRMRLIEAVKREAPSAPGTPEAPSRDDVLEEAARVCDEIESDLFDAYKGRGKYEPFNPHRADVTIEGQSDGAGQCGTAIRKLKRAAQLDGGQEGSESNG